MLFFIFQGVEQVTVEQMAVELRTCQAEPKPTFRHKKLQVCVRPLTANKGYFLYFDEPLSEVHVDNENESLCQ